METREFLDQSIALMASEEMRKFWVCIREAAGFHLSSAECEPFLAFHRFVTKPEPPFITAWGSLDFRAKSAGTVLRFSRGF